MDEAKIKEILTPILAIYDKNFVILIVDILSNYGRLKSKYLKSFLTVENIKLYQCAFTSNSLNSSIDDTSGKIAESQESENSNELFKILGENIFENFMIWYIYRRFPSLRNADDVMIITRLKINHSLKYYFPSFAKDLGFFDFISSSEYEKLHGENNLLKNVFSSFLGVTYTMIENIIGVNGIGFAICYSMLSSFYDKVDIEIISDELNNPVTTLKEFFQQNRYLGTLLPYNEDQDPETKINYCSVYYNYNRNNILLGKAESKSKKDAKKITAEKAIQYLKSKKLFKVKPKIIVYNPITTLINGDRGWKFISTLKNLFTNAGIRGKYIDILLSGDSLKIYNWAFTSNSANSTKSSPDNYEVYEILGDSVFKNFIASYAIQRFQLKKAKDLKLISRIKINYGSEEELAKMARSLGFLSFITASQDLFSTVKKQDKMLEDVFESFLGATCQILDSKARIGVGYCVCYQILKYICDSKVISDEFTVLVDNITLLKEFFDKHKDVGTIHYEIRYSKHHVIQSSAKKGMDYLRKNGYKI